MIRSQAGHVEEPIVDDDEAHAEEVAREQVLERFSSQFVRFGFQTTVVRRHEVRILGDVVGFKSVCESTLLNHIVLAVDDLRAVVVEDDDSVENVVLDFDRAHADASLDLPVQVHTF